MSKNITNILKKFMMIALCLLLALGLSAFSAVCNNSDNKAIAEDSPTLPSATVNGITLQILGAERGDCNQLIVRPCDEMVPGVEVHTELGEVLVANYYLTTRKGETYLPDYYNVSFAVGSELARKVAGRDCRIYILHHDGERETRYLKFNDAGVVTFTMHKLSILSVVTSFNDTEDTGKNISSVSPKTGFPYLFRY